MNSGNISTESLILCSEEIEAQPQFVYGSYITAQIDQCNNLFCFYSQSFMDIQFESFELCNWNILNVFNNGFGCQFRCGNNGVLQVMGSSDDICAPSTTAMLYDGKMWGSVYVPDNKKIN